MADTDKGIYTGDDGLFTYAKIYPVSLLEITKEVLSDLETPAAEVNARIEVGELPTIEADPLQIRQLMQNLIANALKFHKPGKPPTVTISSRLTTSPDIAPVSDRFGATAEIAVQDNGIGFQPRYAEQKEVLDAAA
jgi:signal transduction histidine kinase